MGFRLSGPDFELQDSSKRWTQKNSRKSDRFGSKETFYLLCSMQQTEQVLSDKAALFIVGLNFQLKKERIKEKSSVLLENTFMHSLVDIVA